MEFQQKRGLYHPVSLQEEPPSSVTADHNDRQHNHRGVEATTATEEVESEEDVIVPPRQALEISSAEEDYPEGQTRFLKPVTKDDCVAFPSLVVSWLVLLTLAGIAVMLFRLIGRMFVALPFCLHSTLCALSSRVQLSRSTSGWKSRVLTSIGCLLDIVLLGLIYPKVWTVMIDVFFTDVDGTVVIEWTDERFALRVITLLGQAVAWLRLLDEPDRLLRSSFVVSDRLYKCEASVQSTDSTALRFEACECRAIHFISWARLELVFYGGSLLPLVATLNCPRRVRSHGCDRVLVTVPFDGVHEARSEHHDGVASPSAGKFATSSQG
jgi:hypothetical protein